MFELHTHSTFSDGANTPVEMIEKAIELNYSAFGFSDHITCLASGEPDTGHSLIFKDLPNYFSTINELKNKYKDKIKVLASVEIDYVEDSFLTVYKEVKKYNPDYILAAIHGLGMGKTVWDTDYYKDNINDYVEKCMKANINMVKTGVVDLCGHFDIFKFFYKIDETKYYDLYDEFIEVLKETNTALEINTQPTEIFEFNPYVYKKCSEKNIPVIVSSDAHYIDHFGINFDFAFDFLKSCGVEKKHIDFLGE